MDLIDRDMACQKMTALYEEDCRMYGVSIPECFDSDRAIEALKELPSAEPEKVIPHRNYKYLSTFWCKCGNYLGKKGEVTYCSNCGRKVNWDE